MILEKLCPPAILYVAFSLTHIILDIFKNLYNSALLKFLIMIIFTIVLNMLCKNGLGIISWLIVFIPFISMTIITSLLLMALKLSPSVGSVSQNDNKKDNKKDNKENNNKNENVHNHAHSHTHNNLESFHKKPYQRKKI